MKRIIQNILPYKATVFIIVVMLVIQAYGELLLPQYTSDIVDIGIENNGFEYILPSSVTSEDFDVLTRYLNEEEKAEINSVYEKEGNIYYQLSLSGKELEKLDSDMIVPVLMAVEDISDRSSAQEKVNLMGESLVKSELIQYSINLMKNAGVDVEKMQSDYLKHKGLMMMLITVLTAIDSILAGLFAAKVGSGVGRDLRENLI